MKQWLIAMLVAVVGLAGGLPDAEARRLGGGSSFGMQRQITPQRQPTPQQDLSRQQQAQPATAPGAQPQRRSWMGPIAGLAAGLGLAALFSHLGLSEEMADLIMIGVLVFAAVALFRRLTRGAGSAPNGGLQYAGTALDGAAQGPRPGGQPLAGGVITAADPAFPADFDAEAFARQAKVNFIRLQAANDAGDLDDIRQFTTPEMFAEIRLQLAERGAGTQRTDVVDLGAEVLEVAEEAGRYIVSVRFSGLLREDPGAAPAPFDEVWHLVKPVQGGSGWVVAGIQQVV